MIYKTIILVLCSACLINNAYSQQCAVEYNVDYSGIAIAPSPTTFTATPDICCYACFLNPSCQAWSFVLDTKACFLKSSIGVRVLVTDTRVAGLRQFVALNGTTTTAATTIASAPSTSTATTTTTSTVSTTRLTNCIIEINTNYLGSDIGGKGGVSSASECCNLCGNYPGCAGFAYYSQFNYCYFKGVGSGSLRQPYDGMISGTVTNKA